MATLSDVAIEKFSAAHDMKAKSQEQVRRVLEIEVLKQGCCWGKGPVSKCTISSCVSMSSFHVKYELFVEQRRIEHVQRPFRGVQFSSPSAGMTPKLWEMECSPQKFFENNEERFEVPFTSNVETCQKCNGSKQLPCQT